VILHQDMIAYVVRQKPSQFAHSQAASATSRSDSSIAQVHATGSPLTIRIASESSTSSLWQLSTERYCRG
jgi:hypothetical protein